MLERSVRPPSQRLLRGAKAISQYVFGTEDEHRSIYGMAAQLGLFHLGDGNALYGLPEIIDRKIAEAATQADATIDIAAAK